MIYLISNFIFSLLDNGVSILKPVKMYESQAAHFLKNHNHLVQNAIQDPEVDKVVRSSLARHFSAVGYSSDIPMGDNAEILIQRGDIIVIAESNFTYWLVDTF